MPMDNLMLEKLNEPYSLEAEQAVLGSILMDPDCFDRVSGILRGADCFYIPQHEGDLQTSLPSAKCSTKR